MSKPKTSGYSETFPIGQTGHFQKIWHEEEHEEGDDPRQVLYKCKRIVQEFFYESNKAAEKQQNSPGIPVKETPQSQEAKIIADIYTVKDPKVLESYKIIAKKYPAIQAAYDQQLKELTNV